MSTFWVNGTKHISDENISLLRFLRDKLRLTSVKDGCSQGACGTCSVIKDGDIVRSCTLKVSELDGSRITTVEGLSSREKKVYSYSFAHQGAVQCGFCIPGMVLAAKSLIDRNADPSDKEIRHALRYNICRCTGYVKIVAAIRLAARIFRENLPMPKENKWRIGAAVHRVDAEKKVLGTAIYTDDKYFGDMAYVVALRSKHPRARVLGIDTSVAAACDGVIKILTAADIPGDVKVGHVVRDWDTMIAIGGTTRYVGDVLALVVADTIEHAVAAKGMIKVDYEVLPCVSSPAEAAAPDAPLIHETGNIAAARHISRGDATKAIENSEFVISRHFSTPWTEHAFLEPECAVCIPDNDGVLIYSSDQGVYDTRRETAPMLGLDFDKVRVENCYVGGAFGGKEDMTVQHLCALACHITKRKCKMKMSRAESLMVHPKRHPMEMDFTMGCDKDGIIQGVKAKVVADTGAYASLAGPVLERACTHASGPYNYRNFEVDGTSYYTNNPPAGAFRGFGVTQTCFALESILNEMAEKVGISAWEIRYRNAIRPGQTLPNGQIVDNATALVETLEAVKSEFYGNKFAGIACAMKNAGVGVGMPDYGRVRLLVKKGGVEVYCGGSCLGQGFATVLKQIVCDVTGISGSRVQVMPPDTASSPDSGTTSGSRHTTVSGEAARRAAQMLEKSRRGRPLAEMEGEEFFAEYLAETDPLGADVPNPVSHVAYGYATQLCILDEESGRIRRIISAHDVGRIVNPRSLEGQIEGGVVMSMGFALREKYSLDKCRPAGKFGALGLFRADELPEIQAVAVERDGLSIACGAKGVGEITAIPGAPAIAAAYYAYDGVRRFSLPLENTPYTYAPKVPAVAYPSRRLVCNDGAFCIGCKACVRACARAFGNTDDSCRASLRIEFKNGSYRPVVCIQCGKCEKLCPQKAISRNRQGVYVIDKSLCVNCGTCRANCPLSVMPETVDGKSGKCVSCGQCVSACPMNVLSIVSPQKSSVADI